MNTGDIYVCNKICSIRRHCIQPQVKVEITGQHIEELTGMNIIEFKIIEPERGNIQVYEFFFIKYFYFLKSKGVQ